MLSHGLDLCIPNSNVSSESTFAEFESSLTQLDRHTPVSAEVYSALKAKLNHLAHTVCSINIANDN